jgi:hypothetical protein
MEIREEACYPAGSGVQSGSWGGGVSRLRRYFGAHKDSYHRRLDLDDTLGIALHTSAYWLCDFLRTPKLGSLPCSW